MSRLSTNHLLSTLSGLLLVMTAMPCFGQRTVERQYPLQHATADHAADRVRNLLRDLEPSAEVLTDSSRNRLVIQGNDGTQQLVAQLLTTIDRPALVAQAARPSAQDYKIQGYSVEQDLQGVADRLRQQFATTPGIRIATDERTGQVIVVAPPEIHRQLKIQFAKSPAGAASQPAQQQDDAYTLRHVSWQDLEQGLGSVFAGRLQLIASDGGQVSSVRMGAEVVMRIDRRRNRVLLEGDSASRAAWAKAVEAIDSPRSATEQTQFVPVKNAEPARVRTALALLRTTGRSQGGLLPNGQESRAVPLTTRSGEAAWGGRLVSMLFQQDGQSLDSRNVRPSANTNQGEARVPRTGNLNLQAVEAGVAAAAGEGGLVGPVQIEYLEGLDVIILRGRRADVERVQAIINDIERLSAETQPVVEIVPLKHVNGEAVATLVSEVYEEIFSSRQGQISIRALVQPNAVMLIGRQETVDLVTGLIAKLDQPSDEASKFQVFRLQYVSAIDAETTVRGFFVSQPGANDEVRPGIGTRVQVIADYRSNSLIIQASPRDLKEVERLLESIDVEATEASTEIKVFRLKNALAENLATIMQAAITGTAVTGQANQGGTQGQATLPSAALEFMMVDQTAGKLLRSGILADVQVTADASVNALVVRAPSKSMELIEALIRELDQLPDAEAQVKVFTIINGDATNLAAMLQQLFGQSVTAGQGNAQFAFGFGAQGQAGAAGEGALVPLNFAVDVRTNSIIASGAEDDLLVVETLLLRLDEGDIETRKLTVIRLKNAPALDVANSITSFLTSQRELIQQQLLFNQAISPFEQIEREVIVVPEVVTNSLIVSATPRYYDEIIRVIQDLDFRPPMVMVQVLIAEVKLDDVFQFGVELGLQDSLLFDRGFTNNMSPPTPSYDPGFNFNNVGLPNLSDFARGQVAGQSLTALGLGRTNAALGYGGMVLSAANESVSILIRALQDEGRIQILSRPQIMTLNNQQAFVQVGEDVSRITGTTITNGIVQNNIQDVQTGLILRIQPLINDDGVVVMNLDAERSRLGEESDGTVVAVTENDQPIRAAPIERTTAQTTISAKSGQTVVFAGLITKDKALELRRVPWLSDIPVVGRLFEFETAIERRSELLIVMTPHIIQTDEDYEFIKAMESERMSYCLADVIEAHGEVGLQGGSDIFCCGDIPTIYPDLDPTGNELIPVPAPEAMPFGPPEVRTELTDVPFETFTPSERPANATIPVANSHVSPLPASGFQTTITYGSTPHNTRQSTEPVNLPVQPSTNIAIPVAPASQGDAVVQPRTAVQTLERLPIIQR